MVVQMIVRMASSSSMLIIATSKIAPCTTTINMASTLILTQTATPLQTVMYIPDGADRMYIINNMWSQEVAGVFFIGSWYHKAVIFTENAARVGALTLGGTDTTHNIPFLVAICDYSLIGEELYAMGAYVSEDPINTSSLVGQDIGKFLSIILIILGLILITIGVDITQYL